MSKSNRNAPKRSTASESNYTFYEFDQDFPDDATILAFIVGLLYPEGIHCPKCEKITKHHRVKARTCYSCQFCGHDEYPLVGTIFEGSTTSLKLWFHAIFLMSQTRCGISAKQLERELGVTYKTAWRMANKIRSLLQDEDDEPLSGEVEPDETYYGGRRRGTKRGRPGKDSHKTPVFGMAERKGENSKGRVVAKTVPDTKKKTVMPHVKKKVLPEAMVYTDEYTVYDSLNREGYKHERVHTTPKRFT
jgi:transposase-like protein